jgi:hypothetical protein
VSDSVLEGTLSRSIKVGSAMTGGATLVGGGALLRAGCAAVPTLGTRRGLLMADAGEVAMTRTSGRFVVGVSCASPVPATVSAKRLTAETNPRDRATSPCRRTRPARQIDPPMTSP